MITAKLSVTRINVNISTLQVTFKILYYNEIISLTCKSIKLNRSLSLNDIFTLYGAQCNNNHSKAMWLWWPVDRPLHLLHVSLVIICSAKSTNQWPSQQIHIVSYDTNAQPIKRKILLVKNKHVIQLFSQHWIWLKASIAVNKAVNCWHKTLHIYISKDSKSPVYQLKQLKLSLKTA